MSNNDNIEKAFQERFEHDSVIDQSWNNPSESIWDKIESDLDLKEKVYRVAGFFWQHKYYMYPHQNIFLFGK